MGIPNMVPPRATVGSFAVRVPDADIEVQAPFRGDLGRRRHKGRMPGLSLIA